MMAGFVGVATFVCIAASYAVGLGYGAQIWHSQESAWCAVFAMDHFVWNASHGPPWEAWEVWEVSAGPVKITEGD
jgi:hypothetical protein